MFSKSAFRSERGFTLVELLIVIVIIGILAVTLLPQIMGAPAQARDVGRVASLRSLSTAMQLYYNDNGAFPNSAGECLNPAGTVGAALVGDGYLQSSNFPKDPTSSSTTGGKCSGAGDAGSYYYQSLTKSGIDDNAFLLMADVESDAKANANVSCTSNASAEDVDGCITDGVGAATGTSAVYIQLGGI